MNNEKSDGGDDDGAEWFREESLFKITLACKGLNKNETKLSNLLFFPPISLTSPDISWFEERHQNVGNASCHLFKPRDCERL